MNAIMQFASGHPVLLIALAGGLVLAAINWSAITAKIRKPKPRSIPAQNIDELAVAMLPEACKLDPAERDETMKLVDQIRKITERSMIETAEPTSTKVY
jgi:hypothetical protein